MEPVPRAIISGIENNCDEEEKEIRKKIIFKNAFSRLMQKNCLSIKIPRKNFFGQIGNQFFGASLPHQRLVLQF